MSATGTDRSPAGLGRQGASYVRENGTKLFKYLAVTVGSYVAGQTLLALFLHLGFSAFWSNTMSFLLVVGPNYIGNRYWVWALRSKNSVKGEILPFWLLNVLGYVVSTVAVMLAEAAGWPNWAIVASSTCAFGLIWLLKFFVFENFLFGKQGREATQEDPELVTSER